MGRVSTCQKNCNTIDLRRAQVNNWTTTTYAPMGAFDYTTNGVTMPVHSCMTPWGVDSAADMS